MLSQKNKWGVSKWGGFSCDIVSKDNKCNAQVEKYNDLNLFTRVQISVELGGAQGKRCSNFLLFELYLVMFTVSR